MEKPHLLLLSQVLPFPRQAGQQQRVYYKLKAVRDFFHVTFIAPVDARHAEEVRQKLLALSDDAILLPAKYTRTELARRWHRLIGLFYTVRTGLKFSNYVTSRVELTSARLASALDSRAFDCALYEYWHAWETIPVLRARGIPCVLDMHDVLWQSYTRQLDAQPGVPAWWRRRAVDLYRAQEERAWQQFDGIIAINAGEHRYVQERVPDSTRLFYAPMGTDLGLWPYLWQPASPPRIAYYGSFGSPHNQHDALRCYTAIMPHIWQRVPEAELWLVGSNPPPALRSLASDRRVRVTGYVERVPDVLKTMSLVLCPWSGTYGFRSRLVEVMALGVPVVASPDSVYGMDLDVGRGLFLGASDEALAAACLDLLRNVGLGRQQSALARAQVEEKFSYQTTYERLARELAEFVQERTLNAGRPCPR